MKFEFEHEIQVPFEEKTFILPQPRIKLFQNLIENYKVFCPELKLIYAFLNFNSKNPIDYLLIFTGTRKGEKDFKYAVKNRSGGLCPAPEGLFSGEQGRDEGNGLLEVGMAQTA